MNEINQFMYKLVRLPEVEFGDLTVNFLPFILGTIITWLFVLDKFKDYEQYMSAFWTATIIGFILFVYYRWILD